MKKKEPLEETQDLDKNIKNVMRHIM